MYKKIVSIALIVTLILYISPVITFIALTNSTVYAETSSTSTSTEDTGVKGMRCPDADVDWFSDICYDCIFPISLGGSSWFSIGSNFDSSEDNPNSDWSAGNPVCTCMDSNGVPEFGMLFSYRTISKIFEVVRTPYCEPFLGMDLSGMAISGYSANKTMIGTKGRSGGEAKKSMYHIHYIIFPLLQILEFGFTPDCEEGYYTDIGIGFMSEQVVSWYHDEWALLEHPESIIFANPITQTACLADCAATNVGYPINQLFWCGGCLGSVYPFTGNITYTQSPVANSQLLIMRFLALMHRIGFAWRTEGEDAKCGGYVYPMIPKSQYKISMLFPIAQASGKCCHPLGRHPLVNMTEHRTIPGFGEDYLYVQYTHVDCCVR